MVCPRGGAILRNTRTTEDTRASPKLNIVGIEAVSADQRHAVREVSLERRAVVNVHELGGNKPRGIAALLHPRRGEKEEVNVQARKAVDLDARYPVREGLQAFLVVSLEVMVPDVGRVREDQVRRERAVVACDDTGKVSLHHLKTRLRPEVAGGIAEAGIEFDAYRPLDSLGAEDGERGGIEAARADGGVAETDRAETAARDGLDVAGDLDCEGVGSRELTETVPLSGRLPGIEHRLNRLSAGFNRVLVSRDHRCYSPSFARSSIRCSPTQSSPSAAS